MASSALFPNEEPLDALCRYLNVAKPSYKVGQQLPTMIDLTVLQSGLTPTHVLAVYDTSDTDDPTFQPLLAPISATAVVEKFEVVPTSLSDAVQSPMTKSSGATVTVPLVPLHVPHAVSAPLLILAAVHPQLQSGELAWRLLPADVIGEFPSAADMAQVMAQTCNDEQVRHYAEFNQGLWKNVLALSSRDPALISMIRTAWNVTVEARRIRYKERKQRTSGSS